MECKDIETLPPNNFGQQRIISKINVWSYLHEMMTLSWQRQIQVQIVTTLKLPQGMIEQLLDVSEP